jgi:DNA-binding NarL/FixJ family response regulator
MIRVILVDDHALVREGLRRLLNGSTEIEVIGEASDGVEAIERVKELRPDVALVDVSMPRKDGIEATAEITALGLDTKILILTMYSDEQYALRTLRAGADGFIWKGARFEELCRAIAKVKEGERYLPAEIEERFAADSVEKDSAGQSVDVLSKREFQVMCYLAAGMTNREIAKELGISVKTVDTHRGHVLKKLRLRNNSDITRFAIRRGFVNA